MRLLFSIFVITLVSLPLAGCGRDDTPTNPRSGEQPVGLSAWAKSWQPGLVCYAVGSSDDALSRFDTKTGYADLVGPLHPSPDLYTTPVSMAVRPGDRRIFVWNNSPVAGLVRIDPCTGLATHVGRYVDRGNHGGSIACAPDGTIYMVEGFIWVIDTATGDLTRLRPLVGGFRPAGADFDADGGLWILELTRQAQVRLGKVDIATGRVTDIVILDRDVGTVGGMFFTEDDRLLATGIGGPLNRILYEIDRETGSVTPLTVINGAGTPQGLGLAPPCSPVEILVTMVNPGGNGRSRGRQIARIMITGGQEVDVEDIDHRSLRLGPFGARPIAIPGRREDRNGDGRVDLETLFRLDETGLAPGDDEVCMTGEMKDGRLFTACVGFDHPVHGLPNRPHER